MIKNNVTATEPSPASVYTIAVSLFRFVLSPHSGYKLHKHDCSSWHTNPFTVYSAVGKADEFKGTL